MTSTIQSLFRVENIDEWWSWFDEVQFKEFYRGSVPYDVVKNGAYNRMYVNNTFRYHNKLFGDPRIQLFAKIFLRQMMQESRVDPTL